MKTIKTVCALLGAATLLAAPGAFAQTLNITAPGYTATGDQAGPYTVQIIGNSTIGTIYTGTEAPSVTYGGATEAFQTFCIASEVNYYNGSTYNYQASTAVQPFATEGQTGKESYVTWGTAYLYNAFLHNPNYNSGGVVFGGTGNNAANDALQEAIWTLQNQSFTGIVSLGTEANSTYLATVAADYAADLALASSAASAANVFGGDEANANGAFGVEALNMSTVPDPSSGDYAQPQLVELVPVPEPSTVLAGALLLLPLGVSVLRILRREHA